MKAPPRHNAAFSLVEVALALGVAAFGLVAIFGLLPIGFSSNQAAVQQTAATNLATEIATDLRQVPSASAITANPALSTKSPKYAIDASGTGSTVYLDESGTLVSTAVQALYKAVVVLTQPTAGQRIATYGSIVVSWPAAAPRASGSVAVYVALDRN